MPYPLLLHGKHSKKNVSYEPYGEWLVPWEFEGFESEYEALRAGAGLLDVSYYGLIEVHGSDRVAFLQNLLTNDIKSLNPGSGCPAALIDTNAKLLSDFLVLVNNESILLLCNVSQTDTVKQTLERYLFSEDVSITNHEREQAVLAIQGPNTINVLTQIFQSVISLPSTNDHSLCQLNGIPIRSIRYSLTGSLGALCLCPIEQAFEVWNTLIERGTRFGLQRVGWKALQTARIEAGIPWYGIDMDASNLLPETGLEKNSISETKGCYLGQEIIARMQTYGSVNKKLMGLLIEDSSVPETKVSIQHNEKNVGWITSACYSPTLQRPIALGYLKRGMYEPETAVQIVKDKELLRATVTGLPFIPTYQ